MVHGLIGAEVTAVRAATWVAAFQQPHTAPLDSVRVESPLPVGVAPVVRFLLTTVPPWLQAAGVVVAVVAAAVVLRFLFVRRARIRGWLASRSVAVKIAIAAGAAVLVLGASGAGVATWNYTQHSNEFCTGCHVMDRAVERMASGESHHAKLSCHSCHQQSLMASAHQLYVWVAERPEKIAKHADVPNRVCENCHVTADTAVWQRVAGTAGHRVHLESDSSALRNLKCVTCHGSELHRFQPAANTCGQSACHDAKETRIALAKMAGQTVRHCTTCHQFTSEVPALATRDSARGTLTPGAPQCLACHAMQRVLADFNPNKEPHGAKCGTCHNPHTQTTPNAAAASCATAGCHGNWRDEPFHSGASHRRVGAQCLTCHMPHSAKVDASDCQGCHESVRARGRLRPPLRFDTLKALRRTAMHSARPRHAEFRLPTGTARMTFASFVAPAAPASRTTRTAADSFPHARHEKLACLTCHETGDRHGRLTFERPRGCAICHHQAPARAKCTTCHGNERYATPKPVTVTVTVADHPPKPRTVEFRHALHTSRQCVECHTTPVTLAPAASKVACLDCHENHHAAGRACSSCHTIADPKAAHSTLDIAHQRCDACHTPTTIARLTPTRSLCSTCHTAKARDHYAAKECTTCHFLASPTSYRARLVTPSGR